MIFEREAYRISDDSPSEVALDAVHRFLANSYWAKGIPREVVWRSIRGSLCFSVFHGRELVGFARVITDRATFAYVADVFVVPAHRGRGIATWLLETILAHPELQGLRRWLLATHDAHPLYAKFGFGPLTDPWTLMTRHDPDLYARSGRDGPL